MKPTAETNPWRECPQCRYVGTYSTFDGDVCYVCKIQNRRTRRTVGIILLMTALCIVGAVKCRAGVVTESFINRVALRESGNNPKARGKAGEVGLMQIRKVALDDVNAKHGTKYTMKDLLDPVINKWVGARFLEIQEQRLQAHYRRQPTEVEVYRSYNRGFAGSKRK